MDEGAAQKKLYFDYRRVIRRVLSATEYKIYDALVDRASQVNDGWCWPSYSTIADDTGITGRPTIAKAIQHLGALGVIEIRHGQGTVNYYRPVAATRSIIELLSNPPTSSENEPLPVQKLNGGSSEIELLPVQKLNSNVSNRTNLKNESKLTEKSDPTLENEAVKVYRDIVKLTPSLILREEIARKVRDVDRWRLLVADWCNHPNWNPRSIAKMLAKYEEEENDRARGNGGPGGNWQGAKGQRSYVVEGEDYGGYANPELAAKYLPLFERDGGGKLPDLSG